MRKHTYDVLSNLIIQFSASLTTSDDLLKKSKEENSLSENIGQVLKEHDGREKLSKSINSAFDDLQGDFKNGTINLTVYRQHLKPLKDFFKSSVTKLDVSKLNAEEMLQQIEKFGC